jgi:hypothetical protein
MIHKCPKYIHSILNCYIHNAYCLKIGHNLLHSHMLKSSTHDYETQKYC